MKEKRPDLRAQLTQREAAYERMRLQIVTLRLPPGSGCSEVELAQRLGVGQAAVRYAAQRLAVERLVRVVPRGRTYIAPLNISEIQQAYQARTYLETLAARLAAERATLAALQRLDDSLRRAARALSVGELLEATQSLHTFHANLARASLNEILIGLLDVVTAVTERFEYYRVAELRLPPGSLEHYFDLLAAIERRDVDGADEIVRARIGNLRRDLVAGMVGVTLNVQGHTGGQAAV